jgi:hypothetical protein
MTVELLGGKGRVWSRIKRAHANSRGRSSVAVAYFGKGAAKLLPLGTGSLLVVDASDAAVQAGLTYPKDLLALLEKGVRVCSLPRLHAKVYVFDTVAIISSANASRNSAEILVESGVVTNERTVVSAAKRFVQQAAINDLGRSELKRLQKLYRPPLPLPVQEETTIEAKIHL